MRSCSPRHASWRLGPHSAQQSAGDRHQRQGPRAAGDGPRGRDRTSCSPISRRRPASRWPRCCRRRPIPAIRSTFAVKPRLNDSAPRSPRCWPMPGVDAVLALHVPVPAAPPVATAEAVAAAAHTAAKPVLAAWLGVVDQPDARVALESGGVANFFTPGDRGRCLRVGRRVSAQPGVAAGGAAAAACAERSRSGGGRAVRAQAIAGNRSRLADTETAALLAAFGIPAAPLLRRVDRRGGARVRARGRLPGHARTRRRRHGGTHRLARRKDARTRMDGARCGRVRPAARHGAGSSCASSSNSPCRARCASPCAPIRCSGRSSATARRRRRRASWR